jgi:Ca2+-binding EF-hand superfamily protein
MLVIFTQFLDDEDIKAIRETFQAIDIDNGGTIEVDELLEAYY